MSTPAINDVLAQMQAVSQQAGPQPASGQQVNTAVGGGGFAGELQSAIERVNELKLEAGDQAEAFAAGEPGVELNDVMVAAEKSSVATEMTTQVRNRLVTAYNDIMNIRV
jgi:flagellar hook-basal body complex protein FliE